VKRAYGSGERVAVIVAGHGATTYTLDYTAGGRILAEYLGSVWQSVNAAGTLVAAQEWYRREQYLML